MILLKTLGKSWSKIGKSGLKNEAFIFYQNTFVRFFWVFLWSEWTIICRRFSLTQIRKAQKWLLHHFLRAFLLNVSDFIRKLEDHENSKVFSVLPRNILLSGCHAKNYRHHSEKNSVMLKSETAVSYFWWEFSILGS